MTFMLLSTEILDYRWEIDAMLLRKMLIYTLPLLVVGFGGMINEMIDRFMILNYYPGTLQEQHIINGIYSANYKLAVVIVLFIQAFRLGAEPFFFKSAIKADAALVYARVMKYFVITCCVCFLGVVLFLDLWKYFMGNTHKEYWSGLIVVPLLMVAKIFLGIYYNLSVWYKITNRNMMGAWITIGGAVITIGLNYLLIPHWGYTACAITTIVCYGSMMIASYLMGQKHFPVPYDVKRIIGYILFAVVIYLLYYLLANDMTNIPLKIMIGVICCVVYGICIVLTDKAEFSRLPFISKWISK